MSDPIRDLENLKHEGMNVNPLPASEVRRRGTRMRRRNNAIAAVGALAVVAVVATPLAVVARGGDHAEPVARRHPVAEPDPDRRTRAGCRPSPAARRLRPDRPARRRDVQLHGAPRLGRRRPHALRGADLLDTVERPGRPGGRHRSAPRTARPGTERQRRTHPGALRERPGRGQGPRRGPARRRGLPGRAARPAARPWCTPRWTPSCPPTTPSSSPSRRRWTRTCSPTSRSTRSPASATRSTWPPTTPAPAARRSSTPRCGGWPSGRRRC